MEKYFVFAIPLFFLIIILFQTRRYFKIDNEIFKKKYARRIKILLILIVLTITISILHVSNLM